MSVLSDISIRLAQAKYELVTPWTEEHVQPASYDFCLGDRILFQMGPEQWVSKDLGDQGLTLYPNQFCLGCTRESFRMPPHLTGEVSGRSTWGRKGLAIHITAGWIDPGFCGVVTLEMFNHSAFPLHIPKGARIGQMIFQTLDRECARPYQSKYQNASTVEPPKPG